MFLEYAENIVQLLACLIALLFCLFQYISGKQKGWVYATAVFLCSLMSSYYWTAYLVIMGDYPNVSNLFSYMGWNVAFVFLLLLVTVFDLTEDVSCGAFDILLCLLTGLKYLLNIFSEILQENIIKIIPIIPPINPGISK